MKDNVQLKLKALDSEFAHRADKTADGFAEKMVVVLSDIKFELKYNKTRADEERRKLKQVFDLVNGPQSSRHRICLHGTFPEPTSNTSPRRDSRAAVYTSASSIRCQSACQSVQRSRSRRRC
jgi:hypothetical protein